MLFRSIRILAWCRAVAAFIAEPGAAPDRGRHPGFARHKVSPAAPAGELGRSASRLRHPRVGIAAWPSRRRKYQPKCSCVWGVGAVASWRGVGQLQHSSPNQTLHLTGAAMLVSRDTRSHRRPRQVSWVVRHRGFGIQGWASRRGHHGVVNINRNVLAWAASGH